ncbi:MAG TPA: acyltransferase [Candidatus Paceibacterota bacterium]
MGILNKFILLEERVTLSGIIFKYTLRDSIIGLLALVPATFGVGLRMLIMPLFFGKCGKHLTVRSFATFEFPERITVGDNVSFNEYSWINGAGGIEIGNMVRIAPHVTIASFDHEYKDPNTPIKFQTKRYGKIILEDDVWIGSHVTITKGVRIGRGAVIGAGSVVTSDIPEYSVAVGVPARVIKKRGE